MNERTISKKRGKPALGLTPKDVEPAGFEIGEKVNVQSGDGYIVITPAEAERSAVDLGSAKVEPVEPVVRSEMEARIIGNRLWYAAERLDDKSGVASVASETRQFARRFHRLAKTREDLAEAIDEQQGATA